MATYTKVAFSTLSPGKFFMRDDGTSTLYEKLDPTFFTSQNAVQVVGPSPGGVPASVINGSELVIPSDATVNA